MRQFLTAVIHGESKVGKTYLSGTVPKPALFLDAEAGGMRFLARHYKIVEWTPGEPWPEGDFEIVRCQVKSVDTLLAVYERLRTGHPFKSIVMDSYTEMQSRFKREISADGLLDQQGWGKILSVMEDMAMKFRDLTEHPQHPIDCFVVIAGTRMRDGKYRPFMQGQIANLLPYKVDLCGYLFAAKDEHNNTRRGLRIAVGDPDLYDCGNRLDGMFPDVVWDPNMSTMLEHINNEMNGNN